VQNPSSRGVVAASLAVVAATLAAACFGPASFAGPVRPYTLPPDLTEYFTSRYGTVALTSTLRETPDGPRGSIHVHGNLSLEPRAGITREQRVHGTTYAFLEREAALLDLADLSEIKEEELKFDDKVHMGLRPGSTHITYRRSIHGVPLPDIVYSFNLDPQNRITYFWAMLAPVPASLYDASSDAKLTAEDARAIVDRDLATLGLKKEALVVTAPELNIVQGARVWRVVGTYKPGHDSVSWTYHVDAVTGAIVIRGCSTGYVPPQVHEPSACDAIPQFPAPAGDL
jgi:hypothetical protein